MWEPVLCAPAPGVNGLQEGPHTDCNVSEQLARPTLICRGGKNIYFFAFTALLDDSRTPP